MIPSTAIELGESSDSAVTGPFERLAAGHTERTPGGVFVVINGCDRGEQVVVQDESITIGSAPNCDLVLADRTVSRRHILVSLEKGQVVVRDLDTTNGSFVNGSRFKDIIIGDGAELRLGKTLLTFLPRREALAPQDCGPDHLGALLGRDPKMRRLFWLLRDVAATDSTILLEGETGTGKGLVAREIHRLSRRASGPFVTFDCGAVAANLTHSSICGHFKGAFLGASADCNGAFAEAQGGTLFFDEIDLLSFDLQRALLQPLSKRVVRRVGGNSDEQVDVRVIAATNHDQLYEVTERRLLEELFYRLAVIRVRVPPLRERGHDIDLLVHHFVRQFAPGRQVIIPPAEMQRLRPYRWPGNVRELRNVVERACLVSKGDSLHFEDGLVNKQIAPLPGKFDMRLPFKEAKGLLIAQFERAYLIDLLKRHRDNLSAAAREAEIDRHYLRAMICQYGLPSRDKWLEK